MLSWATSPPSSVPMCDKADRYSCIFADRRSRYTRCSLSVSPSSLSKLASLPGPSSSSSTACPAPPPKLPAAGRAGDAKLAALLGICAVCSCARSAAFSSLRCCSAVTASCSEAKRTPVSHVAMGLQNSKKCADGGEGRGGGASSRLAAVNLRLPSLVHSAAPPVQQNDNRARLLHSARLKRLGALGDGRAAP